MRRRPFRRLRQVAVVALALVASIAPRRLRAQNGIADQAALFLLLPVSARAVGMGQSMMASNGSGDAVWWNPAGIATVRRGDAALHHSQSVIGTSEALTVTAASSLLGVVALSANILDFGGDIPAVDNQGNVVGKILPRNLALVGTYATTIGRRVRAGVSYKLVQFRFDCEGLCPSLPTKQASTSALDGGVQFDLPTKLPITIGAAIRNVGVDLQINDSPQSDPLPTRLQIGATARYVIPKVYADDAELLVSADVIDDVPVGKPLPRVGGEFVWEKKAFLRAGYVFSSGSTESGGPTLGLGFVAGRLVIDFARVFAGLSADAGQAPTYLSLRLTF
ncbi:MAG: PorV/PorQ family protein [Gemmatimonadetes bacterium]|nr:PorV/PorQ family protein [Gemmatimonadota bacterium]MBK9978962.1 PorV/PorQ family protein [Gemmatimonadota bacterium]